MIYIINSKKRLETILEAKSEVLQKISSLQNEQNKKTSMRTPPWLYLLTQLYHTGGFNERQRTT
ncbi:hypothetical protein ScFU149_03980 [Streptococcus canis]|nr:hypothetical protein ScOT1_04860 [Streptococcus canis]GFE44804.1 hypothetical protein ScFU6_05730 [Streptococcus canis]GFK30281.1 hypothetical protein ScFU149_03980 [Streptococcus canis]